MIYIDKNIIVGYLYNIQKKNVYPGTLVKSKDIRVKALGIIIDVHDTTYGNETTRYCSIAWTSPEPLKFIIEVV